MKRVTFYLFLIVCFICFLFIIILGIRAVIYKIQKSGATSASASASNDVDGPLVVYGIMITGKDEQRLQWAALAVQNFADQTYPFKKLVIVNHGERRVIVQSQDENKVYEFMVDKTANKLTLGELRNIALQMVPFGALWTIWDDDDYRPPSYLDALVNKRTELATDVLAICQRMEYNILLQTSWIAAKKSGFVLFIAPRDDRVTYLDLDSMEDMNILDSFANVGYKVKAWKDNSPNMYLRLVHNNNTSRYVNPSKTYLINGPDYSERNVSEDEEKEINKIMSTYFKIHHK